MKTLLDAEFWLRLRNAFGCVKKTAHSDSKAERGHPARISQGLVEIEKTAALIMRAGCPRSGWRIRAALLLNVMISANV